MLGWLLATDSFEHNSSRTKINASTSTGSMHRFFFPYKISSIRGLGVRKQTLYNKRTDTYKKKTLRSIWLV